MKLKQFLAGFCVVVGSLGLIPLGSQQRQAPEMVAAAPLDTPIQTLGQLPTAREKVAAVYVPDQGAAYVFGGRDDAGTLDDIVKVNISTGEVTLLAVTLPEGREAMSAVYVTEQRTVYLFGGSSSGTRLRSVVAFSVDEPHSVSTLTAQLSGNRESTSAVYAPNRRKAYIIGGESSFGTTRIVDEFDPFAPGGPTITQLPSSLWLPEARARTGAVYASHNGRAYVFGGHDAVARADIFEFDFDAGTVRELTPDLPASCSGNAAVYSPETQLAYVLGGAESGAGLITLRDTIIAVDLHDGQPYTTQLNLPAPAYYLAAVHASVERKVCTFGGHSVAPYATRLATIACFQVPSGPAVDVGLWTSPRILGGGVTGITAQEPDNVWFASAGDGAWRYSGTSWTHYTSASTDGALGTDYLTTAAYGDGRAWFGTQDLGVRYRRDSDGVWFNYRAPNLGSDWIHGIDIQPGVDTDDPVRWFATSNGLTRRYWNPSTGSFQWQTLRNADGLADNVVWDVAHQQGATPSSTYLWLGTSGGAQRFRGGASGSLLGVYTGAPEDPNHYADACGGWDTAHDVAVGLEGRKWFSIAGGPDPVPMGVCQLNGSPVVHASWHHYVYDVLSSDDVRDIAVDGEGRVWLATVPYLGQSGGATVMEYTETESEPYTAVYSTANSGLRSNSLLSVGGTQERVYFGSAAGHVDTFAPRWNFYDNVNSALGVDDFFDVWSTLGRLWLRGSGNVLWWIEPDGTTVGSRDLGNGVRAVASDDQNRLWVGTYLGGVHIKDGDTWTQIKTADGLPDNRVFALLADRHRTGWMWVGTEAGLGVWTGDRWLTYSTSNSGLPDPQVRSLAQDRQGRIWIGTYGGGVAVYGESMGWTVYTTVDGLPDNYIGDLVIDGDGHVWVDGATVEGIGEWDGNTWTPHDTTDGLPGSVNHLAIDEQGRVWAGTIRGAAVWQEGDWLVLRPANSGLARDNIAGVATDGAGRVWFVHGANGGLSVRGTLAGPLGALVPGIAGFDPPEGTAGDSITIFGSGFDERCGEFNEVMIGNARATVTSCSPTQLVVTVPPEARTGRITVRARNRTGISPRDFLALPTVVGFSPPGGSVGVEVIINGTNFARETRVCIGGGVCRIAFGSPTEIRVHVEHGDTTGPITVRNVVDETWDTGCCNFTVINLSVNDIVFNQGIPSYQLIRSEDTLAQVFLRSDVAVPGGSVLEIDEVLVEYQTAGGWVSDPFPSGTFDPPQRPGAWNGGVPGWARASLQQSINLWFDGEILEQYDTDPLTMRVTLRNRGHDVAQDVRNVTMETISPVKVLYVLIGPNGWTRADRENTQAAVIIGQADLNRIFPRRVRSDWAPGFIEWNDMIDVENVATAFQLGKLLDDRRAAYNASHPHDPALFVFGIIDDSLQVPGSSSGVSFWSDLSILINFTLTPAAEAWCNSDPIVRLVVSIFADDGTCDLEIPVAWGVSFEAAGSVTAAYDISHELGHSAGLVKPWAVNHDDDNETHSRYDEGEWTGGGLGYDPTLNLHDSPNVQNPVVNLVTRTPLVEAAGAATNPRPKAVMSYAPAINNANSFIEPVDRDELMQFFWLYAANELAPLTAAQPANQIAVSQGQKARAQEWAGPRLRVTGTIDKSTDVVELFSTEVLSDAALPSLPVIGTYTLALVDDADATLAEHGLWVASSITSGRQSSPGWQPVYSAMRTTPQEDGLGFFAATVPFPVAAARIEIRRGATVLASRAVSPSPPGVTILAPLGGTYGSSADLTVQWSAADPDGGSLIYRVFYSADNGATWTPVGSLISGLSFTFNLEDLPGGDQARVRIVASDGFNQGSADSLPFSVGKKAPAARILTPVSGAAYLEGERVPLMGEGCDPEDGCLSGAALEWSSDKDGPLGTGRQLALNLSIGTHTLTLRVQDADSNTSAAYSQVTIVPDYDGDGLPDAEEQRHSDEDPLNPSDGRADPDGDGLSNREELFWGTDHNQADSDGDGRLDGQEVADGSDPGTPDTVPPPPTLSVSPASLIFTSSLGLIGPPPQGSIQLTSGRGSLTWTLNVDVPWLVPQQTAGATPALVSVVASPWGLQDGTYTGTVSLSTMPDGATKTIPVQLTVQGACSYADLDGDGVITIGDIQRVAARWGQVIGGPAFNARYDLDRDGEVGVTDIARVANDWRKKCGPDELGRTKFTPGDALVGSSAISLQSSAGRATMPPEPGTALSRHPVGSDTAVAPTVRVSGPFSVTVGDIFTVEILADGFQNLGGFEFDLAFDDAVVALQDANLGGLLGSTGRTAARLGPWVDTMAGSVAFGGYSYGNQAGASNGGVLGWITFRAVAEGSSALDIQRPLLANTQGDLTLAVDQDGSIEVWPSPYSAFRLYLPFIRR